jgi:CBS domain-containing protein
MFLPLVIAVTVAHAFTVLTLRRSILTEKVARRGFHVSREYAVDPFDVLFARDIMNTSVRVLSAMEPLKDAMSMLVGEGHETGQRLYPVLDAEANIVGAASHDEILAWADDPAKLERPIVELLVGKPLCVFSNETLKTAVHRMAEAGVTRLLVVNPADSRRLVGKIALHDLLKARTRHIEDERRRERVLPWEFVLPRWLRPNGNGAAKEQTP